MNKKFYQKNWFVILMLVVFFPVGLGFMWAETNWKKAVKIIITVLIGVIWLPAIISSAFSDTTTPTTSSSSDVVVETPIVEEPEAPETPDYSYNKSVAEAYMNDLIAGEGDGWYIDSWNFDEETNLLTMNVVVQGAAATAMYNPTSYAESITELDCTMGGVYEKLGMDVCINILNDENTNNVLHTSVDGVAIYDCIIEY